MVAADRRLVRALANWDDLAMTDQLAAVPEYAEPRLWNVQVRTGTPGKDITL